MVLYAQGASLTNFLVKAKGRRTYLAFVKDGLKGDWDRAVRTHYAYKDVHALEAAWLKSVRRKPKAAPDARKGKGTGAPVGKAKPRPSARKGKGNEDEVIYALVAALGDDDREVLENVQVTLRQMGEKAVPALAAGVGERDNNVRAASAFLLGEIGAEAAPALPALGRALKDDDVKVRRAASSAIRWIVEARRGGCPPAVASPLDVPPPTTAP
jgi:hypothetical protein